MCPPSEHGESEAGNAPASTRGAVPGFANQQTHLPRVRDIMVSHPTVVSPDAHVGQAASLMAERRIGCVIVAQHDSADGIFTERDLLRRAVGRPGWEALPLSQFMTPRPVTVGPDEPVTRAVELLDQQQVRHLPVVDGERIVGILSVRDIMRHRATYLQWLVQQQTLELQTKTSELEKRDALMRHHLKLAGRIQRRMLPETHHHLPPFSLSVAFHPLDHVSGDYYDFAVLSPDRLGILIADASGHGIPSALVSVAAKAVFYADGQKASSAPAMLQAMNRHLLVLLEDERFVTMFYGILDRKTLHFSYASAGHLPPLWYRRSAATVTTIEAHGVPLGVVAEPEFDEGTVQLAEGDRLLFYTDGVTECRNEQHSLFGQQRTAALLAEKASASSQVLVQALDAALARFRGPRAHSDDVTCMAVAVGRE